MGQRTYFFNWLCYSLWLRSLIATVIDFSVWEWYFYWCIVPKQSHMRFFLINGRHLSSRVQSSLRATSDGKKPWVQETPSILRDIYQAVSRVVSGPRPPHEQSWDQATHLRATVWVHITLPSFGNLSIRSSPLWLHGYRSRETVNIINNSGIWGPTRHLPLKNNYNVFHETYIMGVSL